MLAEYSALCPVCGVYIAKGRSHIRRLPAVVPVQPHLWKLNLSRGWGDYSPDDDFKLRVWVHERCYSTGVEIAQP